MDIGWQWLEEGCRKPVRGVCNGSWLCGEKALATPSALRLAFQSDHKADIMFCCCKLCGRTLFLLNYTRPLAAVCKRRVVGSLSAVLPTLSALKRVSTTDVNNNNNNSGVLERHFSEL